MAVIERLENQICSCFVCGHKALHYSLYLSFYQRAKLLRFFFYAGDKDEPLHVHVERNDKIAEFWLDPVRLQSSGGFGRTEIIKIHKIIDQNRSKLMEAWNEYFTD